MPCAIIRLPGRMFEILSGTITGWSVNAGLGPPVSYPTIVLYCTLMRPFVSVRGDVWVKVMMGSF
jgi:hypothetical protein